YKRARAGLLPQFTGVDSPYEAPLGPALMLDTGAQTREQAIAALAKAMADFQAR
ncbi:MAG TPA: adenylyl-sulfate kinase, partial [Burkholderiaceae bacterium]